MPTPADRSLTAARARGWLLTRKGSPLIHQWDRYCVDRGLPVAIAYASRTRAWADVSIDWLPACEVPPQGDRAVIERLLGEFLDDRPRRIILGTWWNIPRVPEAPLSGLLLLALGLPRVPLEDMRDARLCPIGGN